MATTTIRVDRDTHARLLALSAASGESLMDTVRDAAEALRRQRYAEKVAAELADLEKKPEAWAEYLAEAEETSVSDGISR